MGLGSFKRAGAAFFVFSSSACLPQVLSPSTVVLRYSTSEPMGNVHTKMSIAPQISAGGGSIIDCLLQLGSSNFSLFPSTLNVDKNTCTISGIPLAALPPTPFTVTAVSSIGVSANAIVTLAVSNCDAAGSPFGGGAGTSASPYLVCTPAQIQNMSSALTSSFQLANSVDLSGGFFNPIGSTSNPFMGNFDGNNQTLSNLSLDLSSTDNVGLFGVLGANATVKNLTLNNFQVVGQSYVGALVGNALGNTALSGIVVKQGSITGTQGQVGGVAGAVSGAASVADSTSSASISGAERAAGLVGWLNSTGGVTHSSASGYVTSSFHCVGGLVGDTLNTTITKSYATGNVTGQGEDVGGLVGCLNNSTIQNTYAMGDVVSYDTYAGGLVGAEYESAATGQVVILNSFSTGHVNATGQMGGLVGGCPGTCETSKGSYWNSSIAPISSYGTGDIGSVSSALQTLDTFAGWDFTTIWAPPAVGSAYPTLR